MTGGKRAGVYSTLPAQVPPELSREGGRQSARDVTDVRIGVSPMTRLLTAVGTCLVLGLTSVARAQDTDAAAPPPHLSVVDGQVFLDRESGRESAEENTPARSRRSSPR